MSKKILILVGKISEDKRKLAGMIESLSNSEVEVILDSFSNITFEIETGKVTVKVSGTDINSFNLVYIRTIGKSHSFTVGILAYYLKKSGIKLVNSRFEYTRAVSDKLTSLVILGLNSIPVIPTFYCNRKLIEVNIDHLINKFGFPIVAKETTKHHSKGIFVLREKADFEKILFHGESDTTGEFLFQKLLPFESEYRLLVLGGRVASVQKMYRDLSGSKSEIDFERKEEFLSKDGVSDDMKKIAEESAKVLDMQVAGVDTMLTKNSETIVIEVNSSPGFTNDINISPEIPELSKYLGEEASK
ncbi:MAG TPA: hypothetical protein VKC54_02020 [Patescibacteria group bacterium]|nr:hypothetical protein [Patescibacteria group bacterium]